MPSRGRRTQNRRFPRVPRSAGGSLTASAPIIPRRIRSCSRPARVLRKPRDRVAHHEPVRTAEVNVLLRRMRRFASYVSAELADYIDHTSSVTHMLALHLTHGLATGSSLDPAPTLWAFLRRAKPAWVM